MNFLIDSQLPPALARWIAGRGHGAIHVAELNLEAVDDSVVWEYASREKLVIISKDEDFVDRWLSNAQGVGLVWIRKGTVQTGRRCSGLNRCGRTFCDVWNRESA